MSTESDTFQGVKHLLQKSKQVGAIKTDLFTHITEIVNRIISHHKYDAYQKFEEISLLIKKTQLNIKNPKTSEEIKQLSQENANIALDKYVDEVRALLSEKVELPPQDKKYVKKQKCIIGDFLEQSQMLQWAGISFGENETYRIYKSINRLAKISGAHSLRFWGRILGKDKDYYVVEGVLNEVEELDIPKNYEQRGQGVNKYVYWVTTDILSDWIQLPDVNPEHIKAAKQFKHIMTGDLNAQVLSTPPFPGKERHLLRAQIARIAHANTLAPAGLLEQDEENEGELKYSEDFAMPNTTELNSTEKWVHHYPNILNAGRITHLKPDVPEDEIDAAMEKLEEEDKVEEKLRAINEDTPIPPLESAYLLRVLGDDQPYNPEEDEGEPITYAANVIKSLRWPGAYTISYGNDYTNVYVGYGTKYGDVSYNPTSPPEVMADPEEKPEQPEPTPLEAPEEPLEPDTDEENKPEGEEDE